MRSSRSQIWAQTAQPAGGVSPKNNHKNWWAHPGSSNFSSKQKTTIMTNIKKQKKLIWGSKLLETSFPAATLCTMHCLWRRGGVPSKDRVLQYAAVRRSLRSQSHPHRLVGINLTKRFLQVLRTKTKEQLLRCMMIYESKEKNNRLKLANLFPKTCYNHQIHLSSE